MNYLLSSLSKCMLIQFSSVKTTVEAQIKIQGTFASQIRARIIKPFQSFKSTVNINFQLFKKALLTSIWKSLKPLETTNAKRTIMSSKQVTWAMVYSKIIPSFWQKPWSIIQPLSCTIIHLFVICFLRSILSRLGGNLVGQVV